MCVGVPATKGGFLPILHYALAVPHGAAVVVAVAYLKFVVGWFTTTLHYVLAVPHGGSGCGGFDFYSTTPHATVLLQQPTPKDAIHDS